VYAIKAFNARTELSCIDAIQKRLDPSSVPLLPTLIAPGRQQAAVGGGGGGVGGAASRRSAGVGPTALSAARVDLDRMCDEYVDKYTLNADQADALRRCSRMLPCSRDNDVNNDGDGSSGSAVSSLSHNNPVLLVHGVFGSGKSYFLAVLVMMLVDIFDAYADKFSEAADGGGARWSILISSGTNVAVDRILSSLLEQGFSNFVRVGSARKIAPVIMPHSTHGSESSDKKELKDLREMLQEPGLSSQERSYISRSIDSLKQGVNRAKLNDTRVVAATLAATEFACLDGFSFPFIVLDEACQMTEPSAVLPIARFGCRSLVMVGDPKQLPPTVPGPEPAHNHGLEQSLFERLMLTAAPERYLMLRTQYRCHPQISGMANELTYGGNLCDGVTAEERAPAVPGLVPLCFFDCDTGNEERQVRGGPR
jgi:hypothetical protein